MEGRAGMVCIQGTPESIDVKTMLDGICNNLPAYARPLFFRFADDLDMTGREEFDISVHCGKFLRGFVNDSDLFKSSMMTERSLIGDIALCL